MKFLPSRRSLITLAALLFAAGCATIAVNHLDQRYGPPDPTRFDSPQSPPPGMSYAEDIQPILDRRCVVCHACYDAPCQLQTTSWEGIARGASKTPVYDAARLLAARPSRLHIDATRASEWRELDFFSVLNERAPTAEANRTLGLMYRLLTLKDQHVPTDESQPENKQVTASHANMCPGETEIDAYAETWPLGGMPFGLPRLPAEEQQSLLGWIESGAPAEGHAPIPEGLQTQVDQWEAFFNGDDNKTRLFARYVYEHLFLAHLHFGDGGGQQYFRLVRSRTPPGSPLDIIPTARPVDDPGVERVFYRFLPERETIVAKTHMPYRLDGERMARWTRLFLDPEYRVDTLPGYSEDTASNPFATFAALPVGARYRFMLDEAEFTIMGFVKGPVCRGQVALNVINDRFWVAFIAPSDEYDSAADSLLQRVMPQLSLPTGSSNTAILAPWLKYGKLNEAYRSGHSRLMAEVTEQDEPGLDLVWDGSDPDVEGRNGNAALTVFRHFDSASVTRGFAGSPPKTAWIIGYPLLERIHYLLVANFDVYGNIGHQANSRLFMDYLRAEGEFNFLALLPEADRIPTRDYWYRDVEEEVRQQVYGGPATTLNVDSAVKYTSGNPRLELMEKIAQRVGPDTSGQADWRSHAPASHHQALEVLSMIRGESLQWFPEAALLVVGNDGSPKAQTTYSVLRNTGHANVSHLLGEERALVPGESSLTLLPGVLGAYPNAFFRVPAKDLPDFTAAIAGLNGTEDYLLLAARWGVGRDHPEFWRFSDALHERYRRDAPVTAGILDFSRLEFW